MSTSSAFSCTCLKGVRSCAICRPDLHEQIKKLTSLENSDSSIFEHYFTSNNSINNKTPLCISSLYCPECDSVFQIMNDDHDQKMNKKKKNQNVLLSCKDHHSISSGEEEESSSLFVKLSNDDFQKLNLKPFSGLAVVPNFISTEQEEMKLVQFLDGVSSSSEVENDGGKNDDDEKVNSQSPAWQSSQSGRRKVDFGPRANFKQRKAQHRATFKGFPSVLKDLNKKVEECISSLSSSRECKFGYRFTCNKGLEVPVNILQEEGDCDCGKFDIGKEEDKVEEITKNNNSNNEPFIIAEIAALDYQPSVCSNLDPHMDDAWIWGSRIVGVSFLSDSVMSFVQTSSILAKRNQEEKEQEKDNSQSVIMVTRVPLPRRALFVMSDATRYHWLHGIHAVDIRERRVSLTIRELARDFVNEEPELAAEFLATAKCFV